jgi:NADH-quinone oxidoreductase subunit J
MTPDLILFFALAVVAVVAALGMLLSTNAIYSALFLILNFGTVAVFFIMLGAPFIALTQVAVYAGAIMVLFLFVIMLLGAEKLRQSEGLPWQRPLAITLAVLLLVEAVLVIFLRVPSPTSSPDLTVGFGSPTMVGEMLFRQYLLPFEVTSVLLLVAMIGAIVLTRREKKR